MQYGNNAFSTLIRISYRPPVFLFYLVVFTHLGAIFSLCYADLPWTPVAAGLFLLLFNLFAYVFKIRQARSEQVSPVLCLNKNNEWSVVVKGTTCKLQLRPAAYVHPCLVILRFYDQRKKLWCFILTRENVEKQDFRRLRVRLLHGETRAED